MTKTDYLLTFTLACALITMTAFCTIAYNVKQIHKTLVVAQPDTTLINQVNALQADIALIGAYINWSIPVNDLQIQKDSIKVEDGSPYPTWGQVYKQLIKK